MFTAAAFEWTLKGCTQQQVQAEVILSHLTLASNLS